MTRAGSEVRPGGGRDLDLALARVHLRTGSLGLARAELEAIAGAGTLDAAGLVDLAEARWRTGDLAGAGDAAQAHLSDGGDALVALVIAAEATAALGRPGEARGLAARAVGKLDGTVDAVFAGMPRSPIWPADHSDTDVAPAGDRTADNAQPDAPAGGERSSSDSWSSPAPSEADAALAAGRAALDVGDLAGAAVQLAVALRLSPFLASTVLEAASAHRSPGLDLVRGDALSALGHEAEARRAWADAAAAARD
jgi:hypothetical protein